MCIQDSSLDLELYSVQHCRNWIGTGRVTRATYLYPKEEKQKHCLVVDILLHKLNFHLKTRKKTTILFLASIEAL